MSNVAVSSDSFTVKPLNLATLSLSNLLPYITSPELILNSHSTWSPGPYTLNATISINGLIVDYDTVEFYVGEEEKWEGEGDCEVCGIIKDSLKIAESQKYESYASSTVKNIEGMSSLRFRVFLNQIVKILGEREAVNYLEVGVYKGSTFVSALDENVGVGKGWAIDDWSLFGGPKEEFLRSVERFGDVVNVHETNAFNFPEIDTLKNVNVYFYDGPHTYTNHFRSITDYYPILSENFILIVDDFNFKDVREGTEEGIKVMNGTVEGFWEVRTGNNELDGGGGGEWHNGCGVYVVRKWLEPVEVVEEVPVVEVVVGVEEVQVPEVVVRGEPLELTGESKKKGLSFSLSPSLTLLALSSLALASLLEITSPPPTEPFNVIFELSSLLPSTPPGFDTLTISVIPSWYPIAAAHFKRLVEAGYYDNCSIYRIIPSFFLQFGLHPNPNVTSVWSSVEVPTNEDITPQKNMRGLVGFVPGSGAQVYVNLSELESHNSRLNSQGLIPFGKVIGTQNREGNWPAIEGIQRKHGQKIDVKRLEKEGKDYLEEFEDLTYIVKAHIIVR